MQVPQKHPWCYDIKIYSYIFRGEESNGNIHFSNKLYFYTLIGVTPDFLEEFFQVTNRRHWEVLKFIPKLSMVKKTMVKFILVQVQ